MRLTFHAVWWQIHGMWRLSRSENKPREQWPEVGKFPTLTIAVERILKLEEASPHSSLFLTAPVRPAQERSDGEIMRHFFYIGKKAAYSLVWCLK